MKKPASFLKRVLPFVLVVATIIVLLVLFRISNFETVSNGTWKLLEETTFRKQTLLSEKFQSYKTLVSSLAFAYSDDFSPENSDILSPLEDMEANTGFDYIRFIDKSGMSHTSKGAEADCSDRPYFIRGMKGETGVCDVQNSRLNGESMIGFFSPVVHNGDNIGVLVGFISQKNLSFLLESEIFGLNVDAFIVTKDGMIVGSDDASLINSDISVALGPVYYSFMKEYTYENNIEVENIHEANNWSDQAFIASIGTEDYYLLMHFPLSYIEEIAATIGSSGNNLFASLLLVFIFFSLYTIMC